MREVALGKPCRTPEAPSWRRWRGAFSAGLCLVLTAAVGCEALLVSPPPASPEPGSLLTDTLFIGFAQDRIELIEGESVAVDIEFEAQYRSPSDPPKWQLGFRAVVESGTASAEDLLVAAGHVGDLYQVLGKGTTWLGMQALPDGIAEPSETFTLHLKPDADVKDASYPPAIELTNAELEIVIHDADAAAICSRVRIRGSPPRRLTRPGCRSSACPSWGIFQTEVTVGAARSVPLQWDMLSDGRINGWRIETLGSRVRHHLVLQWDIERSAEMRVQPCPLSDRGPTLVCTVDACEAYAAGSRIPPPGSPLVCR